MMIWAITRGKDYIYANLDALSSFDMVDTVRKVYVEAVMRDLNPTASDYEITQLMHEYATNLELQEKVRQYARNKSAGSESGTSDSE